jgi:hypothetical protein
MPSDPVLDAVATMKQAEQEIVRLREVNAELLAAAKAAYLGITGEQWNAPSQQQHGFGAYGVITGPLRTAIAKAEEINA